MSTGAPKELQEDPKRGGNLDVPSYHTALGPGRDLMKLLKFEDPVGCTRILKMVKFQGRLQGIHAEKGVGPNIYNWKSIGSIGMQGLFLFLGKVLWRSGGCRGAPGELGPIRSRFLGVPGMFQGHSGEFLEYPCFGVDGLRRPWQILGLIGRVIGGALGLWGLPSRSKGEALLMVLV